MTDIHYPGRVAGNEDIMRMSPVDSKVRENVFPRFSNVNYCNVAVVVCTQMAQNGYIMMFSTETFEYKTVVCSEM